MKACSRFHGETKTAQPIPLPSLQVMSWRHIAYVRSLVARLGVSPTHEQEDLVQEVLIQANRSKGSSLEPRALLFGITRHLVFRWIAKREHERSGLKLSSDEKPEEASVPSAEQDRAELERYRLVHMAIEKLPSYLRTVFVRVEIEGFEMAEVAKELHIPVNTGYTRLHLGRKRFKAAMTTLFARLHIEHCDDI